jgi:hypothetical protein
LLLLTAVGSSLAPFFAGLVISHAGFTPAFVLLAVGAALAGIVSGALFVLARRASKFD